jgi:hypothetical protein
VIPFDEPHGSGDECPREAEVVRAVLSGVWARIDNDELLAHTAECAVCGEVTAIAVLLREDAEQARREVLVPAAGQVWWRAAVRARLERTQAATRPMTWLHGITAAIAFGVLLAGISVAWPSVAGTVQDVRTLVGGLIPGGEVTGAIVGALRQSLTLAFVVAAGLIITPLALYFALSD